jgi:hypothetical protein
MTAAVNAWTGATINPIEPVPGIDGRAFIAYKVTNPSAGIWHYEYALYNENLDRGIQSFSIPLGCAITVSNLGFHAPANHPGYPNDGTVGGAGFSNAAWTPNQTTDALNWSSETFAQNQNANAIRWGTLYNFRFDSNRPPQTVNATIGFYKTGAPIVVAIQAPTPSAPAANVSVSGRIMNLTGQGVANALVSMTDSGTGGRRSTLTSSFGYYSFSDVPSGISYTISPISKRFNFTPQTVLVNDNLTGVDFTAIP